MKTAKYIVMGYSRELTTRECQRFLEDSISIQTDNNPIQDRPVNEVISDGIELLIKSEYDFWGGISDV